MHIKDTLSKNTKILKNDKVINWYMCGPTVYDHAHIGHARNYITNDILIRILNHLGYQVCLNMNITDIDDKIIKKAIDNNKTWDVISKQYENSFIKNMIELNIKMPDMLTRVSEYIPEIISFIETLLEKKYAYKSEFSSSVYFDSENYYKKFTDGFDFHNCENLEEEDNNFIKKEKKSNRDFALWKAVKNIKTENGELAEPSWDSPWGAGRPGWHIECSAMAHSIFGENLTIHSGGIDLKFPHHENERKQCVAMTENNNWVEIFIHIGHLYIDGLKMSKSLKNFISINNIIHKYNSNVLRMFCLVHKYSDNIDYNEEHLDQISQMVKQIENYFSRTKQFIEDETQKLLFKKPSQKEIDIIENINNTKSEITKDFENDFDTPNVIKKIFQLIHTANIFESNFSISLNIYTYIEKIISMLGFVFESINKNTNNYELVNVIKNFRDKIRNYAKNQKQNELYKLSDELRDELLKEFNINLIDDKK